MSKRLGELKSFVGGIADSKKMGQPSSFAFARGIEFRSNPSQYTINPRSENQTGTLVTDLPMWMDVACSNLYAYGNTGKIYQKNVAGTWSLEHTAPNSTGNGLAYFPEDSYLYYAQDKTIGRRSNACGDGLYYDGFLESEGGEPTNTKSLDLVKASSQYASRADTASTSITGDISIEVYAKLASLPASSEVRVLMSKWNVSGNQRSYKFDITTTSAFFGDGRDGALTISTNTTDDPIDANGAGTSGAYTITITNAHASFSSIAAGDKVIIWQVTGTSAGTYQLTDVQSYSGGVLTVTNALSMSYATSGANVCQVIKLKQYTNVTVNTGITYTAKAWNGTKGGLLGYYANGTVTITGTQTAAGKGFRGGRAGQDPNGATQVQINGEQGENETGVQARSRSAAGMGGGGGGLWQVTIEEGGIGGAAGYTVHSADTPKYKRFANGAYGGYGGGSNGAADLTTLFFGGGGGGGGFGDAETNPLSSYGGGGAGGGVNAVFGATITGVGTISANGNAGQSEILDQGYGAPGAGGSNLIKTDTMTFTGAVYAQGGAKSSKNEGAGYTTESAAGSPGRSTVYYLTSQSVTTQDPTITAIQDNTLQTTSGYVLRLLLSSNGTNSETYSVNITDSLDVTTWNRWAVTWHASVSTANFYKNGVNIATRTGAFTAIYDATSGLAIGTEFNSGGTAVNFYDGLLDDVRLWNDIRTDTELTTYNDRVLTGTEANLIAYYKFESNLTDSQSSVLNTLTGTNGPTYSSDVPFSGVTTRADQDVAIVSTGQTYTLGTSLSEAAADRRTFVPTKEPIKSVSLNINTVGTGNWTVVVHDGLNREMASLTVANASLSTGIYEFIFASSFRPILNATYHVHVYSTVGDGKIVTSSVNDMSGTTSTTGAYLSTFYQILVDDDYHPMLPFLDFMAVGNERYVAKVEAGNLYTPHQLVLPAGFRVRCFAVWNEYLAIGTWKGTSITDTDQGKVFLWDGVSDKPNTIIDVLQGGVNAMESAAGILSIIAGYEGKLLQYAGRETQKVTQIPLLEAGKYAEVAPGAMKMWRSILRFGATLNTDSSAVHQGVYGYGRLNVNYPNSLGFDFPLSLGDQTTSMVKVGCLFPYGEKLYVGWQNNNSYGIDAVTVTNSAYATATLELLISDLGKITQGKLPLVYRVDFEPLVSGQTVTLKYKPDRSSGWLTIVTEDTANATEVRGIIDQRVKEFQLACDIATDGDSPVIIQHTLEAEGEEQARGI